MAKVMIPLSAVLRVAEAVVEVCNVSELLDASAGVVEIDLVARTAIVQTPGFRIEPIEFDV